MRVLFTTMPATAHLYPYVPLAWALQGAGHEVCVASHPDMADTITAAGLTAVSVGETEDIAGAVRASVTDERLERITDALALDPADANFRKAIRHYVLAAFALYYPTEPPAPERRPMVDDLVGFARAWRPDLVLWDPICFPSPIAARACGAAHARFLWGVDHAGWARTRLVERLNQPGSGASEDLMAEMMKSTLERLGQEFDEELLVGQWTIDLMPSRMRLPVDLRYMPLRRVPYNGAVTIPDWLYEHPGRPRVCLSLGVSSRHFFPKNNRIPISDMLEMVADLDIELVATLNDAQLASVGSLPKNVRTIDYIPLNLLLPTCSVIIHHGGGGTSAAAAAQKVPQLITPTEGSDRVETARYVVDRGAGLAMPPVESKEFSVDEAKKGLIRMLNEPSFQDGAAALYRDMLATPTPHDIVGALEKMTAEHRG